MAQLFLVRHAQAAFGTDNYDRLTDLGHQQARWLGDYFQERGDRFDQVVAGSLRRHRETVEGVAAAGVPMPPTRIESALDEYDADRVIAAWQDMTGPRAPAPASPAPTSKHDAAARTQHFRRLRDALDAWSTGRLTVPDHRSFAEFTNGAQGAFERAWQDLAERDARILVVSSGGPIAALITHHLVSPPATFVALNLQIRNASVAEFRINRRGAQLVSINTVPHLDTRERRAFITWS
jgi:broad specificity phosphatase PhoE